MARHFAIALIVLIYIKSQCDAFHHNFTFGARHKGKLSIRYLKIGIEILFCIKFWTQNALFKTEGDHFYKNYSGSYKLDTLWNSVEHIRCPPVGFVRNVTYLEINGETVNFCSTLQNSVWKTFQNIFFLSLSLLHSQSSGLASARIVDGGVGKKFIQVDLDMKNIFFMKYNASCYVNNSSATILPSLGLLLLVIAYTFVGSNRKIWWHIRLKASCICIVLIWIKNIYIKLFCYKKHQVLIVDAVGSTDQPSWLKNKEKLQ